MMFELLLEAKECIGWVDVWEEIWDVDLMTEELLCEVRRYRPFIFLPTARTWEDDELESTHFVVVNFTCIRDNRLCFKRWN